MKIVLVGNYELDPIQSMHRYAAMLQDGLPAQGFSVELVKPKGYFGRFKSGLTGAGKWIGYIDKFILFPFVIWRHSRANPGAIYHVCDHSNAMYAHFIARPAVVTCHDLLAVKSALGFYAQNPPTSTGRLLQRWIVSGLRAARNIVCVSEATKRELLSLGGFEADRCRVIYNGLNYPYRPLAFDEAQEALARRPEVLALPRGGFLLHVGGHGWYKNRVGLLRIYFEYVRQGGRLPLVLAGRGMSPEMRRMVATMPDGGRIIEAVDVSNEELNALYSKAAVLVFPSLEEGFGWPVLEAFASGCRVACSGRASLPEVGGNAAVYLDPFDESAAAARVISLLAETDPTVRVQAGEERVRLFDRQALFSELRAVYDEIARANVAG